MDRLRETLSIMAIVSAVVLLHVLPEMAFRLLGCADENPTTTNEDTTMKPKPGAPVTVRVPDPAYDLIPAGSPIPLLYAEEDSDDPTVHIKLFTPYSSWTWLLTEYDPEEQLAFGYCYDASYPEGAELGYVSIAELKSVMLRGIPAVERDLHFQRAPLSVAKKRECP